MQAALSRPVMLRPATAAIVAAIVAILGALPLGLIAASAQAPRATPQGLAPQVLGESGRPPPPPTRQSRRAQAARAGARDVARRAEEDARERGSAQARDRIDRR